MAASQHTDWMPRHRQAMVRALMAAQSGWPAPLLGFKGGTALYFLHGLPRFSVDLDFDLVGEEPAGIRSKLRKHLEAELPGWTVEEDAPGGGMAARFFLGYGGGRTLKFEVSRPACPARFERAVLFGIPVTVMALEPAFAHKLAAAYSRYKSGGSVASRDLFDIKFLFDKAVLPDASVLAFRFARFGLEDTSAASCCHFLADFLESVRALAEPGIMDGLGELLPTPRERSAVKTRLYSDVLALLRAQA